MQSIKSCATGLKVRFFRVMMAIGSRQRGSATGSTLIDESLGPNCNMEPWISVRKLPVAIRLLRSAIELLVILACRTCNSTARNASKRRAGLNLERGSNPRLVCKFLNPDLSATEPLAAPAHPNKGLFVEENFRVHVRLGSDRPRYDQSHLRSRNVCG